MRGLIDTHCHLDMSLFDADREAVLGRAFSHGVSIVVTVGTDVVSSSAAFELSVQFAARGVYAVVGVHPHEAVSVTSGLPENLQSLAREDRVVAVGETGLDFFYEHTPRHIQQDVFARHIAWAREVRKPLVVHIREAYNEALALLRSEGAADIGGVVHCFSGEWEHAKDAMDLGFSISFAGPLTFPKNAELRKIAGRIPLDRLLGETDAPYLAPQAFRGKRNEPAHVRFVYEALAVERGMAQNDLVDALGRNAEALFHFVEAKS